MPNAKEGPGARCWGKGSGKEDCGAEMQKAASMASVLELIFLPAVREEEYRILALNLGVRIAMVDIQ